MKHVFSSVCIVELHSAVELACFQRLIFWGDLKGGGGGAGGGVPINSRHQLTDCVCMHTCPILNWPIKDTINSWPNVCYEETT